MVELRSEKGNPTELDDDCKIFVSRIPTVFDQASVQRIIEGKLGSDAVSEVALVYSKASEDEDRQQPGEDQSVVHKEKTRIDQQGNDDSDNKGEHRGFAFVTLASKDLRDKALKLETLKGGAKKTSTKKFTMYLRPIIRTDETEPSGEQGEDNQEICKEVVGMRKNICFLWTMHRCPYRENCKFNHIDEGGCLEVKTEPTKKKCLKYKKGKCKLGEKCPFSHDFEVKSEENTFQNRPAHEKDCINWKTKGKCRKRDNGCPYRHDKDVLTRALEKVEAKKRKRQEIDNDTSAANKLSKRKPKQPLWVRVFGMAYDTTEDDVRWLFKDCGKIMEIVFPVFEDSGRSKGYCGVLFQSPKAVDNAVELHESDLKGRWLSIQRGKMYLEEWEENERNKIKSRTTH